MWVFFPPFSLSHWWELSWLSWLLTNSTLFLLISDPIPYSSLIYSFRYSPSINWNTYWIICQTVKTVFVGYSNCFLWNLNANPCTYSWRSRTLRSHVLHVDEKSRFTCRWKMRSFFTMHIIFEWSLIELNWRIGPNKHGMICNCQHQYCDHGIYECQIVIEVK